MGKPTYANDADIATYSYTSMDSLQIGNTQILAKDFLKNLTGIFGAPYQFLPTTDPRLEDTDIGAKYAEKIVSRMPLLFLVPCEQKFMPSFDKEDRVTGIEALLGSDDIGSNLSQLLEGQGKYYTAEFACDTYYQYVNTMCRVTAHYMGIADEVIYLPGNSAGVKVGNVNWSNVKNSQFNDLFQIGSSSSKSKAKSTTTNTVTSSQAIIYYLDGLNSISESFSNSSTESQLASTINGYSSQVKEIQFLLGNSKLSNVADALGSSATDLATSIGDSLNNLTGDTLADMIKTGTSAIVTGGKIVFPKIWEDSQFSKSYTLNIKLRSPDHDNLSIFLNIFVPYLHILALTLPIAHINPKDDQDAVSYNAYNAPMLVKAFCKGMFNIDMGLITGLSVERGAECQWNDNGLPTQMDLSIDIEDLYSNLYMSPLESTKTNNPFKKAWSMFSPSDRLKDAVVVAKNTSMMDYLANLAGLNIAEPEMFRTIKMIYSLVKADYSTDNLTAQTHTIIDTTIAKLAANVFSGNLK